MSDELDSIRRRFIEGMSRIGRFWGFPKALGAIYGALYLSPEPLSLDDLVDHVGVTKGAVSTNVRYLARLGMVHKVVRLGERRDYYAAESDFWEIIKGLLKEREKGEFDRAIHAVDECLDMVTALDPSSPDAQLARHYQAQMLHMQRFFRNLDGLVAMVMKLDELRVDAIQRMFARTADRPSNNG